jgi:hypothetical protein
LLHETSHNGPVLDNSQSPTKTGSHNPPIFSLLRTKVKMN